MHKCQACEAAEGFFPAFDCATSCFILQVFLFSCVFTHMAFILCSCVGLGLVLLVLLTLPSSRQKPLILLVWCIFFHLFTVFEICLAPFFSGFIACSRFDTCFRPLPSFTLINPVVSPSCLTIRGLQCCVCIRLLLYAQFSSKHDTVLKCGMKGNQ